MSIENYDTVLSMLSKDQCDWCQIYLPSISRPNSRHRLPPGNVGTRRSILNHVRFAWYWRFMQEATRLPTWDRWMLRDAAP